MQREEFTNCCTSIYENNLVRLLLGESWHPGGLWLTNRLAELAEIGPSDKVIDLGSGNGASAIHIARERGCSVVGIEASERLTAEAQSNIEPALASQVTFKNADAEHLPLRDGEFTVGLSECSLCLLPSETRALKELRRVLTPEAQLAISDMVVEGRLPEPLEELTARVFCIAEGRSLGTKLKTISAAGFSVDHSELHPDALVELIEGIRKKLFVAEVFCGIHKLSLKKEDLQRAKSLVAEAERAVEVGILDYCVILASK
jgi:arsenite methyltransferase